MTSIYSSLFLELSPLLRAFLKYCGLLMVSHLRRHYHYFATTMGLKDTAETPHSRSAEAPNRVVYSVDYVSAVDNFASGRSLVKASN